MSTNNICFCGEIRKCRYIAEKKEPYLELWITFIALSGLKT